MIAPDDDDGVRLVVAVSKAVARDPSHERVGYGEATRPIVSEDVLNPGAGTAEFE